MKTWESTCSGASITARLRSQLGAIIFVAACVAGFSQTDNPAAEVHDNGSQAKRVYLKLQLQKNSFIIGESIPATLTLTNATGKPLAVIETGPLSDFRVEVKDSKGATVPLTSLGEKMGMPPNIMAMLMKTIPAGQATIQVLEIDKIVRLDKPGVYSVTAWRSVSDDGGKVFGIIQSNTANFDIRQ